MEKTIITTYEELKQQGKETYAKLQAAYERKDWLNFSVLADQLKFIKEDLDKCERDSKSQEVVR